MDNYQDIDAFDDEQQCRGGDKNDGRVELNGNFGVVDFQKY